MRRLAVLVVTGLAVAYILWQINVRETLHVLAHASFGWWLLSCGIWIAAVFPLAWRWRVLLGARGVHERHAEQAPHGGIEDGIHATASAGDLDGIGDKIVEEGYDRAIPRAVASLDDLLSAAGI